MKVKKHLIKISKFSLLPYLILAAIVTFSYHQLLGMYFWRDDYSGLYIGQLADITSSPGFAYPYQIALLLEKYAQRLFGLEAQYYFLTVIIFYIIASWLLFYFLKKLWGDVRIAFGGSIIFAAGFIGQDAMKMTMGDGLGTILALDILLFSLIAFLLYLQKQRNMWLIAGLITFALALETAPQRTSSSIVIFLALDWFISGKKNSFQIFFRNILFLIIFLIQYFLHPSVLLLKYQFNTPMNFVSLLVNFSPLYIFNPLGNFGNLIIPTPLQEWINNILGISVKSFTLVKFWLAGLPTILFTIILFIFLKFLRPVSYPISKLGKIIFIEVLLSFLWAWFVYQIPMDKGDLVSIFNGGLLLSFLLIWIILGIPKFKILSFFSIVAIFSLLSIFFVTIPERVLVSYNRYLLLPSFTIAFLPIIFVSKEFYQRNVVKRRLAQILVIGVVVVLILPRLMAAYSTQKEFKQDFSQHAKRMYQDLKFFIPQIKKPTMIYIEGTNKLLQLAVGDAARVGYFGSEVAYAVHYKTQKENIILPQTLGEIPFLLKKFPQLSHEDIYTFIYDGNKLQNTSSIIRGLLTKQNGVSIISSNDWKENNYSEKEKLIKIIPSFKIYTLLPLQIIIPLKFSDSGEDKLKFYWEYNTEGLITEDKFTTIEPIFDNYWHEYKLIIPGGGEYLQSIYFYISKKTSIEIGETTFDYILEK